jgi:hypothetical protein
MWNNPCRGIHQCGRADLSVSHPKSRHDYTFPPAHRVAWLSPHSLPLGRGWWIKLAAIHYPNALPKNRHIVPLFKYSSGVTIAVAKKSGDVPIESA